MSPAELADQLEQSVRRLRALRLELQRCIEAGESVPLTSEDIAYIADLHDNTFRLP